MTRAFFAGMGAAFAAMTGAVVMAVGGTYLLRRLVAARRAQAMRDMVDSAVNFARSRASR